jgi:protein-disulfide isomerase
MRKFFPTLITAAALTMVSMAAAPVLAGKPAAKVAAPYVPKVTLTAAGNAVLGDPAAPKKVVEYMSYACGHCAHFHGAEYKSLRDSHIATGKVSLEIRPIGHNIVGVAAAMAVGCSKPGYYYRTHALFLETQGTWLTKIGGANAATMKTFETGDPVTRIKAVARYGGFYAMMAKRGTNEAQLNACFADPAALNRVLTNGEMLGKVVPSKSTPSFLVNNRLAGGKGATAALLPALGK